MARGDIDNPSGNPTSSDADFSMISMSDVMENNTHQQSNNKDISDPQGEIPKIIKGETLVSSDKSEAQDNAAFSFIKLSNETNAAAHHEYLIDPTGSMHSETVSSDDKLAFRLATYAALCKEIYGRDDPKIIAGDGKFQQLQSDIHGKYEETICHNTNDSAIFSTLFTPKTANGFNDKVFVVKGTDCLGDMRQNFTGTVLGYSKTTMQDDAYNKFIAAVSPVNDSDRFVLAGHSLGGHVVLVMMARLYCEQPQLFDKCEVFAFDPPGTLQPIKDVFKNFNNDNPTNEKKLEKFLQQLSSKSEIVVGHPNLVNVTNKQPVPVYCLSSKYNEQLENFSDSTIAEIKKTTYDTLASHDIGAIARELASIARQEEGKTIALLKKDESWGIGSVKQQLFGGSKRKNKPTKQPQKSDQATHLANSVASTKAPKKQSAPEPYSDLERATHSHLNEVFELPASILPSSMENVGHQENHDQDRNLQHTSDDSSSGINENGSSNVDIGTNPTVVEGSVERSESNSDEDSTQNSLIANGQLHIEEASSNSGNLTTYSQAGFVASHDDSVNSSDDDKQHVEIATTALAHNNDKVDSDESDSDDSIDLEALFSSAYDSNQGTQEARQLSKNNEKEKAVNAAISEPEKPVENKMELLPTPQKGSLNEPSSETSDIKSQQKQSDLSHVKGRSDVDAHEPLSPASGAEVISNAPTSTHSTGNHDTPSAEGKTKKVAAMVSKRRWFTLVCGVVIVGLSLASVFSGLGFIAMVGFAVGAGVMGVPFFYSGFTGFTKPGQRYLTKKVDSKAFDHGSQALHVTNLTDDSTSNRDKTPSPK